MSDDESKPANATPDSPGGLGGITLQGARDVRLLAKAVRQKWDIPAEAFGALPAAMVEMALDPAASDRARTSAAKCAIAMHGQNEAAERDAAAPQPGSAFAAVQVNINGASESSIGIVRRMDFYGNDAHDLEAESSAALPAEASASGIAEPGTVQDADLRSKVGKDGIRAHGASGGARPDAGAVAGSH